MVIAGESISEGKIISVVATTGTKARVSRYSKEGDNLIVNESFDKYDVVDFSAEGRGLGCV